jgi:hypothetical protein
MNEGTGRDNNSMKYSVNVGHLAAFEVEADEIHQEGPLIVFTIEQGEKVIAMINAAYFKSAVKLETIH